MNQPTGEDWTEGMKDLVEIARLSRTLDTAGFHQTFKFSIGEKVYSRIHECKGIVEYSEMTRFINGDQISYKVRFNDPEDMKTETAMIDEEWLDKI